MKDYYEFKREQQIENEVDQMRLEAMETEDRYYQEVNNK
jgi:hypothetical protein